ncbi:NAD-dependent epimerase/dehydratase family protein [Streptomyces sp. NPDC048506]|uniref:NAD-dependent epimerase/dehydratase family protein n=1 Tax=Streptomyces sp. NPDC048506 TaxID=3155028 RepID=UPI003445371D
MAEPTTTPATAFPGRAVVTGAAGFIGSHLTAALLRNGTSVVGIDRRDPATAPAALTDAAADGSPLHHHVRTDLLTCALEPVMQGADVVFHLAGIPGVRPSWGRQFSEYVHTNILATQRVMEAAARTAVRRVVVASSSSVYGPAGGTPSAENALPQPVSPYAVTKLAEEQLCFAHAARADCPTSVVALRYFTVYGPGQRSDMFIHRTLRAALTGQPLRLYGDGQQRRDFTYVDDTVAATVAAATAPGGSGIVNVGGGSNASLRDVVDIAQSLTGREIRIHRVTVCPGDVPATLADPRHAQRLLGWKPSVDLRSGMFQQLHFLAAQEHRATVGHGEA